MKPPRSLTVALSALAALAIAGAHPVVAQEEPLAAGSEGVPVPKKTKHVQPSYPQEALAQGIRGIVILDLVLDTQGKVESTSVIRSVPGLDEAAIAAARQWEYEPIKVDGKNVRVRLTVPITFALALPKLERQSGVPELRQGATPSWPAGASGGGLVSAEVTLEPDGRVGVARVLEGGPPWAASLLAAIRTWRFAVPPEDEVLSFRVEAEFVSARGSEPQRVDLKASGLQRSGLLPEPAAAAPPAAPAAPSVPAATDSPVAEAPTSAPQAPVPQAETVPPPASPESAPLATVPTPVAPQTTAPPTTAPEPSSPPPSSSPAAESAPAAPPVEEVMTAPPPALPPENGVSAIRDVTLEPGVPDLTRGRRPVTPPLARMTGAAGKVEVTFSVSAAGTTTVQGTTGPELLRPAAEQAVASWVFRRTRADRAYLIAIFDYTGDQGSAVVRPHPAPAAGVTPAPSTGPASPPPPLP